MDYQEVCDTFDGSPFYEELRGDFRKIQNSIEDKRRRACSKDENAAVVLLQAILCLSLGDPREARRLLDELQEQSYGIRWACRAQLYVLLVEGTVSNPPLFSVCGLRHKAEGALWSWNSRQRRQRAASSRQYLQLNDNRYGVGAFPSMPPIDVLEFRLLSIVDSMRWYTYAQIIDMPDDQTAWNIVDTQFGSLARRILEVEMSALELGLHQVAAFVNYLLWESSRHGSDVEGALAACEAMRRIYLDGDDKHGLGFCELLRADTLLSTQHSSPMLLNLDIADTVDREIDPGLCSNTAFRLYRSESLLMYEMKLILDHQTNASPVWNMQDELYRRSPAGLVSVDHDYEQTLQAAFHKIQAPNGKHVSQYYQKAIDVIGQLESPRIVANVAMRNASLLLMTLLDPYHRHKRHPLFCTNHHIQAHWHMLSLAETSALSCGDSQLLALITLHKSLREKGDYGRTETSHAAIDTVVDDISNHDNDPFGICLGLLARSIGLYFKCVCGEYSPALRAFEVSSLLFRAGKDGGGYKALSSGMDSILHWAQLKYDYGDFRGARNALMRLLDDCESLIEDAFDSTEVQILQNYRQAVIARAPGAQDIDPRYASMEPEESLPSQLYRDNIVARGTVLHRLLNRIVEQLLDVDCQVQAPWQFPEAYIMDIVDLPPIPGVDGRNTRYGRGWQIWIRRRISFLKALCSSRYHESIGEPTNAKKMLTEYLMEHPLKTEMDLYDKYYLIVIASRVEDGHCIQSTLASIRNEDLIEVSHLRWEKHVQALRSLEMILQCCIVARDWKRAATILGKIHLNYRGYLAEPGSTTSTWTWQRWLWAGVVANGIAQSPSMEADRRSAMCFERSVSALKYNIPQAPLEGRLIHDLPDVGRLMNCLVRQQIAPSCSSIPDGAKTDDILQTDAWMKALFWSEYCRSQFALESARRVGSHSDNTSDYQRELLRELRSRIDLTDDEIEELVDQSVADNQTDGISSPLETSFLRPSTEQSDPTLASSLNPTLKDYFTTIPSMTCVLYINTSEDGTSIFVVSNRGIETALWDGEPRARTISMRRLISIYNGMMENPGETTNGYDHETLAEYMSDILIKPIASFLRGRAHVIVVGSGYLLKFPFGVLLLDDSPIGLQVAISYCTSLAFLWHLTQRAASKSDKFVLAQGQTLVVANPAKKKQTNEPNQEKYIPMAAVEAVMLSRLHTATAVTGMDLSRSKFANRLRGAKVVHVAAHGYNVAYSSFSSYISLKDHFRVIDLLATHTNIELAIFSACFSGTAQVSDSGGFLGFAQSTLAAGANAFLGALWRANDIATMFHMFLFHCFLLVLEEPRSLASLWKDATVALYGMTKEQQIWLLEYFQRSWVEIRESMQYEVHYTVKGVPKVRNEFLQKGDVEIQKVIDELKSDVVKLDTRHPAFWAPFQMIGHGGLEIYPGAENDGKKLARDVLRYIKTPD